MPNTYRDKRTQLFAAGQRVKEFQGFADQAYRRLEILMALRSNRFEALGGNRKGQFSIRINFKWRICFEWPAGAPRPCNIEITDYH